MLSIQIYNDKVIFNESTATFSAGFVANLKDLSIKELQSLRNLILKIHFEKVKGE